MSAKHIARFHECGCCGQYHWAEYAGDCRNDAERFDYPSDDPRLNLPEDSFTVWTLDEQMEGLGR